jgi:hypothetical protein
VASGCYSGVGRGGVVGGVVVVSNGSYVKAINWPLVPLDKTPQNRHGVTQERGCRYRVRDPCVCAVIYALAGLYHSGLVP